MGRRGRNWSRRWATCSNGCCGSTSRVTEHTKLADELGMSSSQGVQLVLDLERDLAIMVDVEDFDQDEVATVGDMADYIAAHSTPE